MVPAQGWALINTQLLLAISKGTYGQIAAQIGLVTKFGIGVGVGVVDPDYCGIVYILLVNCGNHNFKVQTGDQATQLILEWVLLPALVEVPNLEDDPQDPLPPFLLPALSSATSSLFNKTPTLTPSLETFDSTFPWSAVTIGEKTSMTCTGNCTNSCRCEVCLSCIDIVDCLVVRAERFL